MEGFFILSTLFIFLRFAEATWWDLESVAMRARLAARVSQIFAFSVRCAEM